jgi:ABC-type antimicrobial peptide transport system permease subunit
MFYNLKIILRNLRRNGLYSTINISGLAVSLAVYILISLWVKDELSFDRFINHGDRIYRVLSHNKASNDYWATTPAPMAAFMQTGIPQIEEYCRIGNYHNRCNYLDCENTKFRNYFMLAVDTSFFDMFDVTLISGDLQNPLPDDLSLIISETKAKQFFGNEDPVGKALKTPFDFYFTVRGVMEDMPENSSVRADILVRFDVQQRTFPGNGPWTQIEEDWGSYWYQTFFKLSVGSDPEIVAALMSEKRESNSDLRLQALYEIHLYNLAGEPEGIKNVYLFSVIAILILVIACINHVNLVTARANKRGKEICIRKIVGAKKLNLFGQLIAETAVMLIVAMLVATALIMLLIPYFNDLSGKNLHFDFNPSIIVIYLTAGIVTLLLAGLYPAFTLTSFRPTDAFLKNIKGKGGKTFQKILVVTQFASSVALIVATVAIVSQLRYMQNMNPGYNKENVLTTALHGASASQYRTIIERLSSEPAIVGASASMLDKMMVHGSRNDVWRDKDGNSPNFAWALVDPEFLSLMEIPIVEGRHFSEVGETMFQRGIILNETAAKLIGGGESVIGMILPFAGGDSEIIGVVKDFNFSSLHEEIQPLVLNCIVEWQPNLYVKTASGKAQQAISAVEKVWKEYNADYDFEYTFIDENFDRLYKSDVRNGQLFTIFAVIAIMISCLGLFGLVTYTAESKTKEIGIRKVHGASVVSVITMLSKEFLILVGIAILIAFPPAYYWLDRLLQDYAYRITIGWWMFALSGMITLALTLATVGWKAIKAATANPVEAIKGE